MGQIPRCQPVSTMRVCVYRNLHKSGVQFSIKHKGRVIDYKKNVLLRNAQFKHPNFEQRERCKSKREVCCWVNGDLASDSEFLECLQSIIEADALVKCKGDSGSWRPLSCDPKKVAYFQDKFSGVKVDTARFVVLNEFGVFYCK